MRLTTEEIDLLRGSFQHIAQMQGQAAAIFYDRLFELAPETRSLFATDLEHLGAKMISMLGAIVGQIHDIAVLAPMVGDLARRHVTYGVRPRHYQTMQAAMLWMLAQTLGPRFTPEVEAAWTRAFDGLTETMLAAAYPTEAA